MTPSEFAAKWRGVETGERASAQSHFLDLCRVLGQPGPTDADPTGEWYAFERGAEKFGGGDGFADVWKRGFLRDPLRARARPRPSGSARRSAAEASARARLRERAPVCDLLASDGR
jgi:hypothetical protein